MNRQAQAVVLLLLGGAVLKASVTDIYLRYVREGLRPFLIAAGVMLVLAAVMTLWYDLRSPSGTGLRHQHDGHEQDGHDGHGHDGHEHDGHQHGGGAGHREPRIGWLLILPVLGLLLVAPPALGSYAAGQSGTALGSRRDSDYPPLPAGDPVPVSMLDYASRAVFEQGRSLGDRRVKLTGFLAAGPGGGQYLARMILACCAADARPIKVGLDGDGPGAGELSADTWIQMIGRYTDRTATDPVNGETVPYIRVESWQQVPAPRQQYE